MRLTIIDMGIYSSNIFLEQGMI